MTSPEPLLGTTHLAEIGKLTVLTAQIEAHVVSVTAMLVSPDITEIGHAVAGKQHFFPLLQLAKQVLPLRLGADTPAADLAEPLLQWFTDAQRVMHWRNQLLHAIWMIYAEQQTALVLRRSGETEDVSLAKLCRYTADAEQVARQGGNLWLELTARYGHFDALIEATKAMDPNWSDDPDT